jgi:putative transposase
MLLPTPLFEFGNPYQMRGHRGVSLSGFTHLQTPFIHGKVLAMNTVKIYQLNNLSHKQFQRCKAAQMQAAQVWNACMETHKAARLNQRQWPGRNGLQRATKGGQFALHSQSVQMVVGAFLATISTTKELRQTHPQMQMKYPWRTKRFYPVKWPAQAVSRERGRVVLPMGRGRPSLVLPIALPENSGACSLVWNNGFELHVCREIPPFTYLRPGKSRSRSSRADTPQRCLSQDLAQPRIADTVSVETGQTSAVA